MNLAAILDSEFSEPERVSPLLHAVEVPGSAAWGKDELRIPDGFLERWRGFDPSVSGQVASFLAAVAEPRATVVRRRANCPDMPLAIATDVENGGALLRAAFPVLERCLAGVAYSRGGVNLRVSCNGIHAATFLGVLRPTGRSVHFGVIHDFAIRGGRVIEERVWIDVPSIVRQIVSRSAKEPR